MSLRAGVLFAVVMGFAPPVFAEDPAAAREAYLECRKLLDADAPCKALEICQKGMTAAELPALRELTAEVETACDTLKARRKKKRNKKLEAPTCSKGQEITADTAGQCCWKGQVWNVDRCFGKPTACPDGHDVLIDGCALKTCLDGQKRPDSIHCCWPGQVWSQTRQVCVGPPTCPEPYIAEGEYCLMDRDQDGFEDELTDLCPDAPEDEDGYKDLDGCPDLDHDEDGVEDTVDACPEAAETLNGIEDEDGCPEPDSDGDGLVDVVDACPDAVGLSAQQGCPEPEPLPPPDRTQRLAGWTLLIGGTLLAAGGGGALHLLAESDRDRVREPSQVDDLGTIESITEVEAHELQESANTLDAVALTLVGVGSAAVATGVVLLILDALAVSELEATGLRLDVTPTELGLRWTTRF